jgi:pyruvate dehydrogenase E2 component (dihydrolipoamide acetyltransferase)
MATPVEVPKLGNTVEECIVAKWRKRKGDAVSAGDIIAEIETDKATFEVPSPVDGTLLATFFDEGSLVPVFTNLFVIGEADENAEAFRPQSSGATDHSPTVVAQNAPITEPRALASGPAASANGPAASGNLSPRARRFADEHNFQAASVAGSGPGGRVLEEDLRSAFYGGNAVRAPVPVSPPRASTIREKIARRMRESLASTAQYTLNASANASGLLALRTRIKASANLPDININDLVSFCTVQALKQMPELNAEFIDGKIHMHSEIHLGFACDTPRGLLVPVIRDAHKITIAELARTAKELTAQAVEGRISPDNLSGATFTISNLGGLGIESFTPLLNPPQVAILGVGAIELKPVRRGDAVEFIDAIGLSLTCDHQVIDGAPGARFLQVLKEKIERVESICTI